MSDMPELGPELNADEVMLAPEEGARHVTIWNRTEGRKIAGNAAPLRRNLQRYLLKHPDCEEYKGQDKLLPAAGGSGGGYIDPITGERMNEHVPIWHKLERRKVTGNAAPIKKNCQTYLAKHPEYELYTGQDKAAAVVEVGDPGRSQISNSVGLAIGSSTGVVAGIPVASIPVAVAPAAAGPHRATAFGIASAVSRAEPLTIPTPAAMAVDAASSLATTPPMASSWSNAPFWPAMTRSAGIPIPGRGGGGETPGVAAASLTGSVNMDMSFGGTSPLAGFFGAQSPRNGGQSGVHAAFSPSTFLHFAASPPKGRPGADQNGGDGMEQ